MSQKTDVLAQLRSGCPITSLSALMDHGIISLPKRICELQADGIRINKRRKEVTKRNGQQAHIIVYSLA